MAYTDLYTIDFKNEEQQDVHVVLSKKDAPPADLIPLTIDTFEININSDTGSILDEIYWRELVISANLDDSIPVDWETFIDSTQNDWMVIATIDSKFVFHGFLVPDEGPAPFLDKPYDITLRATDGLKLLSKQALTKPDATDFIHEHTLIEYIAGCLAKTGLSLEIKTYANIFQNAMNRRTDDIKNDMFAQVQVDARTFKNSPTEFIDCYSVLIAMFKEHFHIAYDNGQWVVYRKAEYQILYNDRYFTIYDSFGVAQSGGIDAENYGEVGKNNIIYPINETASRSANFANKSVRTTYKYNVWPEIPTNSKFERGTLQTGSTAVDKYYSIDNWTAGKPISGGYPIVNHTLAVPAGSFLRHSVFNSYNVEIDRLIEGKNLASGGPGTLRDVLVSEEIPIDQGDIIGINLQMRVGFNNSPTLNPVLGLRIFIVPDDGSSTIQINNTGGDVFTDFPWSTALDGMDFKSDIGDPSQFMSISGDAKPAPKTGKMFVVFFGWVNSDYGKFIYKDFSITYTPYIAGGYIPITGDYWNRSRVSTDPDTRDTEVSISDSLKKITKGAMLSGPDNGLPLRLWGYDWVRDGLFGSEIRHYKELVNMGAYNLTYRRFWKIGGDWNGLVYSANNDQTNYKPLSFTPRYLFTDIAGQKLFALTCPVQMDIVKARFNATFIEVSRDNNDGIQEDAAEFKYLFE